MNTPIQMILMMFAGWVNEHQRAVIAYLQEECLDRTVILGEGHLRRTIQSYVEHYHLERSHQGLGNRLIESGRSQPTAGPVARQERLGGLLNLYYREAA